MASQADNHGSPPHSASDAPEPGRFAQYFTPEQANSTLVLVTRIVQDITQRFGRYLELRTLLADSSAKVEDAEKLSQARDEMRSLTEELAALQEELAGVGCVLKDWQRGLVDFPARMHDRDVWLCWKLGEPRVGYWHELNTGFANRRALDDPDSLPRMPTANGARPEPS